MNCMVGEYLICLMTFTGNEHNVAGFGFQGAVIASLLSATLSYGQPV